MSTSESRRANLLRDIREKCIKLKKEVKTHWILKTKFDVENTNYMSDDSDNDKTPNNNDDNK